ncbi:M15 family metallopeptidase [Desulfomonile tiedjei]|uniref:D-alanyl-D-alanine dipeptidase n=1 Tax=Desulfomonile tiedjei (strain ATCC 49306 / DSM 6799 / DCB-1) TaxID=706587 RepID=I4C4Y8_DESTA|nr:M15 family metallopeptidase [Desulfomonile tiedjei]AFM24629.1 D-alanyl-D-alanine dipeptidase [Desulfomonile tiedjei DSM 6799]
MKRRCAVILTLCSISLYSTLFPALILAEALPEGFVYVETIIPDIHTELRYFSDENFLGCRVSGYLAPRCILTKEAAESLKKVQDELKQFGMGLKIFDAYRPQCAVDHFVQWGKDLNDTKMQAKYYPDVQKRDLFKEGYIAERSSHSRGSTVDLTIVYLDQQSTELDMGTHFDFFGPEAWPESPLVSPVHRAHRMLLNVLMKKYGFDSYSKEWWHFTLKNEPFPHTYFNFPVR